MMGRRVKIARKYSVEATRIIENQLTIQQCFDKYIFVKRIEGQSDATIATKINTYKQFHKVVYKFVKYELPQQLTVQDIRQTIDYMKKDYILHEDDNRVSDRYKTKGLAVTTINNIITFNRAFYNWLVAEKYILENPFDRVKLLKESVNVESLKMNEIKLLLSGFNQKTFAGFRAYVLTVLLLDTGMRSAEGIETKISDIDFSQNIIYLSAERTKTNKMRYVPFSQKTNKLLRELIAETVEVGSEYLFPTIYGNRPFDKRFYRLQLTEVSKKQEITHVHPHLLRHTYATQYLNNGGDAISLQRILGHANMNMTMRYVEFTQTDMLIKQAKFSPIANLLKKKI